MSTQITLDLAKAGITYSVIEIKGGWGIRQRLNRMGIHPGDGVTIKRSGFMGGPVLIQIHGTEVAMGRGMAKKVILDAKEKSTE